VENLMAAAPIHKAAEEADEEALLALLEWQA
jgi:hypothetical protein